MLEHMSNFLATGNFCLFFTAFLAKVENKYAVLENVRNMYTIKYSKNSNI